MQTIVIGHKNPDMDSICSAIGCAELKRLSGWLDVIPARCGPTNPRIDFALHRFGIEAPVLLSDLSARVSDVMQPNVVSVHVDTPIYDAIQLIDRRRLRGLPVVDDRLRCVGLLNAHKIMHHLFPPREEASAARTVTASLAAIARTVGASEAVTVRAALASSRGGKRWCMILCAFSRPVQRRRSSTTGRPRSRRRSMSWMAS